MKTIEKTVYELSELSEQAREKAWFEWQASNYWDPFDFPDYYQTIIDDHGFDLDFGGRFNAFEYSIGGNDDRVTLKDNSTIFSGCNWEKIGLTKREISVLDLVIIVPARNGRECTIDQQYFHGPSYPRHQDLVDSIEQKIDRGLSNMLDDLYNALKLDYEDSISFERFQDDCEQCEWFFNEDGGLA